MKFKFTRLTKHESSENHLGTEQDVDTFSKGNYNSEDLENSTLPYEIKRVGNKKLMRMKKGNTIVITQNTIETFILQKE